MLFNSCHTIYELPLWCVEWCKRKQTQHDMMSSRKRQQNSEEE